MGEGDVPIWIFHLAGGQDDLRAILKPHAALRQIPDANLRALEISHQGDVLALLLRNPPHHLRRPAFALVRAVRIVQARHGHPGADHRADNIWGIGRGAKRADNLRQWHTPSL